MTQNGYSVTEKVIRQLEYYFGNANLSRDTFLMGEMSKDNGWVSIDTMLRFKRLGEIVNGNASQIVESVSCSESELLELNTDSTKIRRNPSIPMPEFDESYKRDQNARSCYVKGFTIDEQNGFERIQEYLETFGSESVHLRPFMRTESPYRSVFVTFKSQEQANDFLSNNETVFDHVELVKMTKTEYLKRNPKSGNKNRPDGNKKNQNRNRHNKFETGASGKIDPSEILYEFEINVEPTNHCFTDSE